MPWFAFPATLVAAIASVQDPVQDPIVTDRPDFTESSFVVPLGSTQIESGFTWLRLDGQNSSLSGLEVLIRKSLSKKAELRIGLPNYNWQYSSGNPTQQGFDDTYLGFKFQLGPTRDGTEMAIIPAIFLPSGRNGIRSESHALDLKFVWARSLPNDLSLSGMLYWSNPMTNGQRTDTWEHTVSLGIPLREKLGMFVEHVLDASKGSVPDHLLHSGFTFQPNPNTQFDIHFGVALSGGGPNSFIGAGYSVRF